MLKSSVCKFNLLVIFQTILLVSLIISLLFAIDKGFDFKDEALSILLFNKNSELNHSFYRFNFLFPLEMGIVETRVLKLFSLVLMGFVLVRHCKLKIEALTTLFLVSSLFCVYTLFGQSISYNNLIFILLFSYFIIIRQLNWMNPVGSILWLSILAALSFYPKFTSSIFLFA